VSKGKKQSSSSSASRATAARDADTGQFLLAARHYVSSNTASKEAASRKLKELGISDRSGKLGKNYR